MRISEKILNKHGISGGISSLFDGGGDDPSTQKLSPQQMKDWNGYVDYVEKMGYKGSTELDKKSTGLARKLFDNYLKENPSASIKYDDVKKVQMEMEELKNNVQGFAKRRNDPNAEKLMSGISKVDGWPGSRTTQYKFPIMQEVSYHNNELVSNRNLGLMGGDMKPTGQQGIASGIAKKLPPNVKLEKLQDGYYYEDPQTGDLVKYQ